jgi:septum formation protein
MIILGSQSPRRKEILNFFTIPFEVKPSHFDEDSIVFQGDALAYAETLAEKKGEVLTQQFPDHVVISADTVVYCNNKIFNKPKDRAQAKEFLSELSGTTHEVITAVSVSKNNISFCKAEKTKILFNCLTIDQIEQYLSHFAFSDKAGGYAIQQGGGIIVSKIEGCYYNVMGLPINTLRELLLKFEIDLWKHLKIF